MNGSGAGRVRGRRDGKSHPGKSSFVNPVEDQGVTNFDNDDSSVAEPSVVGMDKDEAIVAVRLLNDLWWDIMAGDGTLQALEEHEVPIRPGDHLLYLQRMIFFHLAMVLCKLVEFRDHYARCLPGEARSWLKELSIEVKRRRLRELRNKAIGHIHDKTTGKPLTRDQLEALFQKGVDGDSERFFKWMRNAKHPDDLHTVMGRVMWLRDAIMMAHGLSAADVGLKPSEQSK